jgi:hypothetical protein
MQCWCNVDGPSEECNENINILVLELLLKSFHVLLLLENCLCLKDCSYSMLRAMIPLLGGTSMKVNFQMLHSWSNKFLAFLGHKLEEGEWSIVLGCWHLCGIVVYKSRTLIGSSLLWKIGLMIHALIVRRKWIWKNTWKWKYHWQMTIMIWLKSGIFQGVKCRW